eukprot:3041284-Prymnesium_polylepis.1
MTDSSQPRAQVSNARGFVALLAVMDAGFRVGCLRFISPLSRTETYHVRRKQATSYVATAHGDYLSVLSST